MSDPLNYLGSIWYHSVPPDICYSANKFLALDFFADSYCKTALVFVPKIRHVWKFPKYKESEMQK